MSKEAIELALKRAFQYGADHWYQTDHDSYKENKKADKTLAEFLHFVEKTCAALAERKPLTPERVNAMAEAHGIDGDARHWYVVGLVDAQEKHGIKENT